MTDYAESLGYGIAVVPGYGLNPQRERQCVHCGEWVRSEGPIMRSHRANSCPVYRETVKVPGVCDA